MTNPAKAKGSQFERDVVKFLRLWCGRPEIERRYGAGAQEDKGDIQGFAKPGLVVECKNVARVDLATIMDETEREVIAARASLGVAIIKRRRAPIGSAYCVLDLHALAVLLVQAGFGDH